LKKKKKVVITEGFQSLRKVFSEEPENSHNRGKRGHGVIMGIPEGKTGNRDT